MERTLLFVDYANINANVRENGYEFNYERFINYIAEGRFLIDSYIYVPINPRNEHKRDREIEDLWLSGYLVNKKVGTIASNTYKCDFDVEITMDITNAIYEIKPDIIVLASGDSDFIPLVEKLRKQGIRIEVASFKNSVSRGMILKSSGFIDLDIYCAENNNEEIEIISSNDNKQNLIDEYNDDNEDLELKTKKNEYIKKIEDEENKNELIIKEKINEVLIEEFEIETVEIDKYLKIKNEKIELKEVDIDIDIDIKNYDDPWDWE